MRTGRPTVPRVSWPTGGRRIDAGTLTCPYAADFGLRRRAARQSVRGDLGGRRYQARPSCVRSRYPIFRHGAPLRQRTFRASDRSCAARSRETITRCRRKSVGCCCRMPRAARDQNGCVGVLPFVSAGTARATERCEASTTACSGSVWRGSTTRSSTTLRAMRGDSQPARFREGDGRRRARAGPAPAEGVIAGFGLGVNDWQVCVAALAHADLDVLLLAGRYTLLDQTALPGFSRSVRNADARGARRALQFGDPRNRQPAGRRAPRLLQLRAGGPEVLARGVDRGAVRCARRSAQGSGAASSAGASGGRCVLAGAAGRARRGVRLRVRALQHRDRPARPRGAAGAGSAPRPFHRGHPDLPGPLRRADGAHRPHARPEGRYGQRGRGHRYRDGEGGARRGRDRGAGPHRSWRRPASPKPNFC